MYQPYIESDVIVYTGAGVFGLVHIKSGERIKAGCVVTEK